MCDSRSLIEQVTPNSIISQVHQSVEWSWNVNLVSIEILLLNHFFRNYTKYSFTSNSLLTDYVYSELRCFFLYQDGTVEIYPLRLKQIRVYLNVWLWHQIQTLYVRLFCSLCKSWYASILEQRLSAYSMGNVTETQQVLLSYW